MSVSFKIQLQPSGRSFDCDGGALVLQSGLDQGFFMPFNCRSGVCKTCRGKIISGQVDFGAVHPKYLSEQDKEQGWALLCCAKPLSDLVVQVQELDPNSILPKKIMPCRVLELERAAPDVILLKIGLPANEPMHFRAGQYVEFILPDGVRRSYSIANVPSSEGVRQIELHIRYMPKGLFTERLFSALKVRDILRLEMPLGNFYVREETDKPMIMLASGTGFAPIKSMVELLISKGSQRDIHVYWGGRSQQDIYMMNVACAWATSNANVHFTPVLSEPIDGTWTGCTGFVHHAVMRDFPDLREFQVYACGAPVMVDSAQRDFITKCHLPEQEFYADSFVSEADRAGTTP